MKLEDILDIPIAEGRRGLEKAKDIVRAALDAEASKVKTKPGALDKSTKVVK